MAAHRTRATAGQACQASGRVRTGRRPGDAQTRRRREISRRRHEQPELHGRSDRAQRRHHADLHVESAYGKYDFDGVEFTKLRLREIDAAAALEKMSKSEAWAKSFGNAAVAPLKFGVSFIVNPAEP